MIQIPPFTSSPLDATNKHRHHQFRWVSVGGGETLPFQRHPRTNRDGAFSQGLEVCKTRNIRIFQISSWYCNVSSRSHVRNVWFSDVGSWCPWLTIPLSSLNIISKSPNIVLHTPSSGSHKQILSNRFVRLIWLITLQVRVPIAWCGHEKKKPKTENRKYENKQNKQPG